MNLDENAAISYPNDDGEQAGAGDYESALAEAERQLMPRQGVHGVGMSSTPTGTRVIVVYVEDQEALTQLPAMVNGFAIVGEITGEIRAL